MLQISSFTYVICNCLMLDIGPNILKNCSTPLHKHISSVTMHVDYVSVLSLQISFSSIRAQIVY